MDALKALLRSGFETMTIDLRNDRWHKDLTTGAGWYFITTDTPISVLTNVPSPPSEYTNEDGEQKKCGNYDIRSRARTMAALIQDTGILCSGDGVRPIYSGMAKSIVDRARDHTFAHRGTAGLALAYYESLFPFRWTFHYLSMNLPVQSPAHRDILLRLGEQMWRATHGWPLLCSR